MTPCTPRRIIPVGVATYLEYATLGLAGLGILSFIVCAVKATADAMAKNRCVHACVHAESMSAYYEAHNSVVHSLTDRSPQHSSPQLRGEERVGALGAVGGRRSGGAPRVQALLLPAGDRLHARVHHQGTGGGSLRDTTTSTPSHTHSYPTTDIYCCRSYTHRPRRASRPRARA